MEEGKVDEKRERKRSERGFRHRIQREATMR